MLELNERVLTELDRRDAAVGERENEARLALEQALARCASERAAIAQEKTVLVQAQQLYLRFLEAPGASTADAVQPGKFERVDSGIDAASSDAQPAPVPTAVPSSGFDPGPEFDSRIRDLRSGLRDQLIAEEKAEQKGGKWSGPLRGLLSPGS
jgi:hypothetical protein